MVTCVHCNAGQSLGTDRYRCWFAGTEAICTVCGGAFDLWERMLDATEFIGIASVPLSVAGAMTTTMMVPVDTTKVLELSAADLEIPDDATILRVLTTMNVGGEFPERVPAMIPMHNQPLPVTRVRLPLLFAPYPSDLDLPDLNLAVQVSWIPATTPAERWRALTDAFDAYSDHRFEEAILPANRAVELTLRALMDSVVGKFAGADQVRNFLTDAATYGHQWNVLLPLVVGLTGATPLPDEIRGQINRLRKLRNSVGHGSNEVDVKPADQARLMVAAVLAVQYLGIIAEDIGATT